MSGTGQAPVSSSTLQQRCLERKVTFTLAPDPLAPVTMEAWLRESLMMRQPLPTSAGRMTLLVAKPMPKVIAASFPTYSATWLSSSRCTGGCPCRHRTPMSFAMHVSIPHSLTSLGNNYCGNGSAANIHAKQCRGDCAIMGGPEELHKDFPDALSPCDTCCACILIGCRKSITGWWAMHEGAHQHPSGSCTLPSPDCSSCPAPAGCSTHPRRRTPSSCMTPDSGTPSPSPSA